MRDVATAVPRKETGNTDLCTCSELGVNLTLGVLFNPIGSDYCHSLCLVFVFGVLGLDSLLDIFTVLSPHCYTAFVLSLPIPYLTWR